MHHVIISSCQVIKSSNDLLENTGEASTLSGGSPSGNGADGALGVPGHNEDQDQDHDDLNLLFHAGGQADCSNVGSHAENRFLKILDCDNLIWPKL